MKADRRLTHIDFTRHLNASFRLSRAHVRQGPAPHSEQDIALGQSLELVLLEVNDLSDRFEVPEGFRKPFSLIFRGPAGHLLAQGLYSLQQEQGDPITLFLVPVGAESEGFLYESVFN